LAFSLSPLAFFRGALALVMVVAGSLETACCLVQGAAVNYVGRLGASTRLFRKGLSS
jgi:hypothetical protein